MTITDAARSDLYQYLKEHMGEERASTVMALVPPVGWGDMATKQDLTHETAMLRVEMQAEFAAVRTELADFRTELKTEIADFRAELKTEIADVRTDLKTEIADVRTELHKTLRTHTLFIVGTNITLFGLAVATVRLAV